MLNISIVIFSTISIFLLGILLSLWNEIPLVNSLKLRYESPIQPFNIFIIFGLVAVTVLFGGSLYIDTHPTEKPKEEKTSSVSNPDELIDVYSISVDDTTTLLSKELYDVFSVIEQYGIATGDSVTIHHSQMKVKDYNRIK